MLEDTREDTGGVESIEDSESGSGEERDPSGGADDEESVSIEEHASSVVGGTTSRKRTRRGKRSKAVRQSRAIHRAGGFTEAEVQRFILEAAEAAACKAVVMGGPVRMLDPGANRDGAPRKS